MGLKFCVNEFTELTKVMGAHRNFCREGQGLGDMAGAECEPISEVCGQNPQRGGKLKALKQLHT